jgi:hypothetical protein
MKSSTKEMSVSADKLNRAFSQIGTDTIKTGDGGLTRKELRMLERHGHIERFRTEARKWKDITGTIQYVYRRKRSGL